MSQDSNAAPENSKPLLDTRLSNEGDVDLFQLIKVLWQGKLIISLSLIHI